MHYNYHMCTYVISSCVVIVTEESGKEKQSHDNAQAYEVTIFYFSYNNITIVIVLVSTIGHQEAAVRSAYDASIRHFQTKTPTAVAGSNRAFTVVREG